MASKNLTNKRMFILKPYSVSLLDAINQLQDGKGEVYIFDNLDSAKDSINQDLSPDADLMHLVEVVISNEYELVVPEEYYTLKKVA